MNVFVHYKIQNLENFVEELVRLNTLYAKRSYSLDKEIIEFINACQAFYHQIGDSSNELEMSKLGIYFHTALKGIDPIKMEKLKSGRREIVWISAFHCLTELADQIQYSLQNARQILNNAEETISQVLLSAVQAQIIDLETLKSIDSVDKTVLLWQQMIEDEQIALIDKKLKTTLVEQDIYLSLFALISKIS